MANSWSWGGRTGALLLGLGVSACSAIHHDCAERRDCPEPDPIDIGTGDAWWSTGSGGQAGDANPSSFAAGDGGEGGSEAGAANGKSESESDALVKPSIVHVSPSDGAQGVTNDVRIVIDFGQPMDTLASEAAYQSSDLPAAGLGFEWDETETRLTLTPHAPLGYATSALGGADLGFPARTYRYGFAVGARTRLGQPLAPVALSFSTLRRVELEVPADADRTGNWTDGEGEGIHNCLRHPKSPYLPTVCVGDDPNNVAYAGFLSFDLSALPAGISAISSARWVASAALHGTPELLGASRLEHVAFGDLDVAARSATAFARLGPLFAGSLAGKSELDLSVDVTAAVADDYAHRGVRANRTQYRLGFAQVVPNAHWDDVELPTSSVRLALSYLIP